MIYTLEDLKKDSIVAGDPDAAIFINSIFDETKRHYLKLHRDWYINERFHRGDHWITYNKTLNKVQTVPVSSGEIRRTVNKIRSQVRGIKNFVKRNQPRWEVHPNDVTDEAYENATKLNKILQNIYRTQKVKDKLTDVVINGLKYSTGIMEGSVIETNGQISTTYWCDDTFDIFFDPSSPTVKGCRYIIKAVVKPLTSILNNKKYTFRDHAIAPDNKSGSSQYKELLEQEKYQDGTAKGLKDMESSILKEFWMVWEENEKTKVKMFTVVGTELVRVYKPKYRRYPFFVYNPERDPNAIHSSAWVKDLISLNKSLDKTTSQVEGYIQRMLAGKYLIKQGVEVSSITDNGAEKIYYKGSTPPVQQQLQPLPAAPFTHISNLERWIEELGGIREASLGRAPGSVQSGKGIEALQQADAATVAEPIENLETMLEEMAEFSLEVISDYQLATQSVVHGREKIDYIGKIDNPPEGALVVEPLEVKVTIVPEIAYSEDTKIERLFMLADKQMVDPQTILEMLSFSNVSDVLERVKNMKKETMKEDLTMQNASHQSGGGNGQPQDSADLADQENTQMLSGQQATPTPQALWAPEHLQLHMAFLQENQNDINNNPEVKAMFEDHISQEEQY